MKQMVATEQIENIRDTKEVVDIVNKAIESGEIETGKKLYLHIIEFTGGSHSSFGVDNAVARIYTTSPNVMTSRDFIEYLKKFPATQNSRTPIFTLNGDVYQSKNKITYVSLFVSAYGTSTSQVTITWFTSNTQWSTQQISFSVLNDNVYEM